MKKLMRIWTLVFAGAMVMGSFDAEAARRMGGGRSIGKQSGNVTQREASPQAPATPNAAPNQQNAARQATPPAATPQPAPSRPWGAMLGGLAAGLGLAWLAHSLGFGPAMANVLLVLLLAFAVMVAIGWFMRSRRPAMAGAYGSPAEVAQAPRQYSPDKVGNDASARPWERSSMAFEAPKQQPAVGGIRIGSGLAGPQGWGIPAGFDVAGFVDASKRNFLTLQDAWDRSDIAVLRSMMTDEMLSEIRNQLAERERESGGQPNHTDVVLLEAQLLGVEDLGADYMASVEFSGMIREQPSAGPSPFREVWNMTKPKNGSTGWLVAGVQALQ
jgi:predicted lipid-binding transport protein (Tim44 family)